MPFETILGQTTAVETLTRALRNGVVHHAYRFEGLDGVGKELTAIAFAQALLCTEQPRVGCGHCRSCRRVAQRHEHDPCVPLHPDVVLVGRALYPPDTIGGKREASEISVEQVRRVVLTRANYAPHEGLAQVFIVRDAEQLSVSAANALLKTLEEPRPNTHFVLLTSRSERLIDTIRSRSLPVRFGPLSNRVLATILTQHDVPAEGIAQAVELAGGSAAAALREADPEQSDEREQFVKRVIAAVDNPGLGKAVKLSERLGSDRKGLLAALRALAAHYVRHARHCVSSHPAAAEISARRHALVIDALAAVERNGAAALAVSSLVASLQHAWPRRPGKPPAIVVQRR